jgi:phosphinothricin acetyltransferase
LTVPESKTTADRPQVRASRDDDLPEIAAIYAHHVRHGLASFEETPPDLAVMTRRRQTLLDRGLPYLVAEIDGRLCGYAYVGPYRSRPGYRHTLENSVYVDPGFERRGAGALLLAELIRLAAGQGYRRMVAVIGDSANLASIRLHERQGFRRVGTLTSVGFKFGRWVDSVILERALGAGDTTLPEATPPVP